MEKVAVLIIPALFGVALVRSLWMPLGFLWKLAIHSACGFGCLWLLNWVAPFTGIEFPVNAVTVLVSGFLGLPGIGILALLAVW